MRIWMALLVTAGALMAAGCGGQNELVRQQAATIDSLEMETLKLRTRAGVFQDSLQFTSDVETGQYARDMRRLRARLDRMQYDITVLREGGRTVEVLPADALFEPASDTLTEGGRTRLDTLGARLGRLYPERDLRVEGHSDDEPLGASLKEKYASNWGLSAARAAAVVYYLTETRGLAPARFTLAAYGARQPVASNETAAGRRQNRRVRIAVLPEPRDYTRPFDAATF